MILWADFFLKLLIYLVHYIFDAIQLNTKTVPSARNMVLHGYKETTTYYTLYIIHVILQTTYPYNQNIFLPKSLFFVFCFF